MEDLLEESVLDRAAWAYALGRLGGIVVVAAAIFVIRGEARLLLYVMQACFALVGLAITVSLGRRQR